MFLETIKNLHNQYTLLKVGDVIFTYYGIMIGIAWSMATVFCSTMLVSCGVSFIQVWTLLKYSCPCGFLGARLMSFLLEDLPNLTSKNWMSKLFRPGFYFHGGVIGELCAIIFWYSTENIPISLGNLFDISLLACIVWDTFSRLGCHVYGCCYGKEMKNCTCLKNFSVRYTNENCAVLRIERRLKNKPLYPAQLIGFVLYSTVFLICFGILCVVEVALYTATCAVVLHGSARIIHEMFRKDDRKSGVFGLTSTESVAVFSSLAMVFYVYQFGNSSGKNHVFGADVYGSFLEIKSSPSFLFLVLYPFLFGFTLWGTQYKKPGTFGF
jgi:prolipoprotein diacylglyceryltransferase